MAFDEHALAYFQKLPKIELHLHLEGAIPLPVLWMLMGKYGGDPAVRTREDLAARFRYRDFPHFLQTWVWKNGFLREYEDFTLIATEAARDLASQHVLYAETFYSPGDFAGRHLDVQRLTQAIRAGLQKVPEIEIALVTDLVRNTGPERADRVLSAIAEMRVEMGIVGVGIGGAEHDFPLEPFGPVYERARSLGFRTTAHAGEAAGPESVWGAVRSLGVERIGHGTSAARDPALVDYLAEHRIAIELCPISNVKTGAVASLADHPARLYFDRGLALSVNTDDPKLFNTSLAQEYLALCSELRFTTSEIHALIDQAVGCSWLADERKGELLQRLRAGRE